MNLKDIPALQRSGNNLTEVVEAIREAVQTFRGYRGNDLDRALTPRDFKTGELRALLQGSGIGSTVVVGGGGGGTGGGVAPDMTPPPTPTGFIASAGVSHVYIEHDTPTYTQGHGHDRTLVFGAQWAEADPTPPTFGEAVPLMHFQGAFGAFPTNPGTRWKLWIKWQSVDGVASVDPAGGTNGQEATTAYDPSVLLDVLQGQITESQLYATLGTRINLIDGPATTAGTVAARIKAEADARAAALTAEALARTNALSDEAAARAAAIGVEATNRVNAILQEQSDRAAAISSLASTLGADIDSAVAQIDSTATTLRSEFATADSATLSSAQSFTYSRAAIDAADAATLTTLRSEFATADADTLADAQAYVQSYGYTFAGANTAIADAVNTVSARLNAGGDVYSSIASTQTKVDAKSANFVQATAPTNPSNGVALRVGDLWVDTGNGNKLKRWSGSAWVDADDTRIGTTATQVTTLTSQVGNKSKVFRQRAQPAATAAGDLWIDTGSQNLLGRSEQHSNAYWSKARATITTDAAVASDGTLSAEKLVEDTQTGPHHTSRSFNWVAGLTYILSCEFKAGERSKGVIQLGNGVIKFGGGAGGNATCTFDLVAGTAVVNGNAAGGGITQLGDGWFRAWVAGVPQTSGYDSAFLLFLSNGAATSYTGNGTSGMYYSKSMLEATADGVAAPGRYLATTGDSASESTVGNNKTYVWDGLAWQLSDDARIEATKALLLNEYTTTAGMDSAIASAVTTLRSEFQGADDSISATLSTDYYTKAAADSAIASSTSTLAAQLRGSYTGADLGSITSGLLYQERQARIGQDNALAQQITLLSAGAGEQFDYSDIWYFDAGVEGWSAPAGVTLSQVDGWLRGAATSGNVASPLLRSPDNLGIEGAKYTQVRLRIRKVGTPGWTGKLWFNTTVDATFDATKTATVSAPSFDANGISVVTWNMPAAWAGATIRQVHVEPGSITATSYYELDWVAIGRPSPGASSAQLSELQQAIADGDSAQATATETLATQVRGSHTGTDITLAGGLFAAERTARSTADSAEVTARQSLSTKLTGATNPSSLTLATLSSGLLYDERQARSTADTAQVTRISSLEATVNNPATGVTATASGLSSLTAVVNNGTTGLSATVTRVDSVEAQISDPTTGLTATAAALDVLEAEVRDSGSGLSATLSRVTSLESKVDAPTTGLLARASVLESTVTNATSGNAALASRALTLEASINSPSGTPGSAGYNPTYAALQTEASTRATADGALQAQYTVKVDVNGYVSGFGLASTAVTAVPTSSFIVRADKFAISSPSGPGITPITPFVVNTTAQTENGVSIPPGVYMDGAYIRNLTAAVARLGSAWIDDSKIANLSAAKLTAGTGEIGGPLKSTNYAAGTAGWILQPNGAAQMPAASIIGQLTAAQINSNGLSIRDTAGNIILSAGATAAASTFSGNVTGQVAGTSAATLLSTANTASTNATNALNQLTEIASDGKLTPVEKQLTKLEWDGIGAEKTGIEAQATALGITTEKTAYTNAYTTLSTYITPLLSSLTTTSDITGSTFRSNFSTFYSARQALMNKMASVAATMATWATVSGAGKPLDNAGKVVDLGAGSASFGQRDRNDAPAEYVAAGTYWQFKNSAAIGLVGASSYATLETTVPYGAPSDASGGPIVQYAYSGDKTWRRNGARNGSTAAAWSAWVQDLDRNAYTGDLNATNGAPAGTLVGGVAASTIALAATNFNASNDRNAGAVAAPTIAADGTSVDHTLRDDGSADISFEWAWAGDNGDIDGFQVFVYQGTSAAYTFGTTPAAETVYEVPAAKRAFILFGVPANTYYTFGVRAYRKVHKDVDPAGVILSTLVKPSAAGENPYRPSSSVAFLGDVTGTVAGLDAAALVTTANTAATNASDALANAATANSLLADIASDTKLTPGEKHDLRREWDAIYSERAGIRAQADAIGGAAAEKTAYDSAFQTLGTYLNAGAAYTIGATPPSWITDAQLSVTTTLISAGSFRSNWASLYSTRQVLLNKIAEIAATKATWSSISGAGKPADNATVGAPAGTLVGGVAAETIATAATNFNAANDRDTSAITAPTIAGDGTAVDHTIRADGACDISFEWLWSGSEGAIDGFRVYVYQSSSSAAYTFGTTPAAETVYEVPASKRAFIVFGALPTNYFTFGVQAYRSVDTAVQASGVILSTLVKPTAPGEGPYRPDTVVAFAGNVTGTINGTAAATLVSLATTADANATSALGLLTDIASDAKLTPVEKQSVRAEWDAIYAEKSGINTQATALGITTENTAYNTAFQTLGTYLNGGAAYTIGATPPSWLTDANLGTTTAIAGATFRTNWSALYSARQALLNKMAAVAATKADWGGVSGNKPMRWRVRAAGLDAYNAGFGVGLTNLDTSFEAGAGNMWNVAVFNRSTGEYIERQVYDPLNGGLTAANAMAAYLNALGADRFVVVYTYDEPEWNRMLGNLPAAMYRCGASPGVFGRASFAYRGAYILIGVVGCGQGNGAEFYAGPAGSSTQSWLDVAFTVQYGSPIVSGSGSQPVIDAGNAPVYISDAWIGQAIADGLLKSSNYVPGGSGWSISKSGSVEFGSGTFRGSLSAATGTFAGTLTAAAINAVDSINIKGNAIHVAAGGEAYANVTSTTESTFLTLGTLNTTVNGVAQPLYLHITFDGQVVASATGGGLTQVTYVLRINGTSIITWTFAATVPSTTRAHSKSQPVYITSPPTGDFTVSVTGYLHGTTAGPAEADTQIILFALGVKR